LVWENVLVTYGCNIFLDELADVQANPVRVFY